MNKARIRRTAVITALSLLGGVATAVTAASTAGAVAPNRPLNTVGANGDVLAIQADAEHVYIGGRFTYVGANTNAGVVVDEATGTRISGLARVKGGSVRAAVGDGRGGWYIGGDFTTVGGSSRPGLARITSNGSLAAWAPPVSGRVDALAFANGIVYVGGTFTSVGGASRANLAAVDAAGAVTTWNPGTDGPVRSLAVAGTTVFVGGSFTSAAGTARANLAAVAADTGAAVAWAASTDGPVNEVVTAGGTVYAGGEFGLAGGSPRANLAAFGAGGALTPWNPGTDGAVHALAARGDGTAVYVGGTFGSAGSAPRANLAAVGTADGMATAWNPGVNGPVLDLGLSRALTGVPADSTLYVGGTFTTAAGAVRFNGAGIATADGAATPWDPGTDTTVRTVTRSGASLFVGGDFTWINGAPRQYIAALHRDTLELDRDWNPGADAAVRTLAVAADGSAVYVGGEFLRFGGLDRKRMAAVVPSTGAVTAWAPRANGTVASIVAGATNVYIGGTFGSVNGVARARIAAITRSTGALVTAWNPGASGTVRFLELSPDGTRVYAGGNYQTIGGASRPGCAELDAASGVVTPFAPTAGGDIVSMDLARDGSRLWCSTSSNRTYAYDPVGGVNAPLWTVQTSGDVQATDDGPADLYIGGHFSSIKGNPTARRLHAASLDPASGLPTAWDPTVYGNYGVWELTVIDDLVFIGGDFDLVGTRTQPRLAVFTSA